MKACCRKHLRQYTGPTTRTACGCGKEWNHVIPGWAKPVDSDRVYHLGQYVGTHNGYGTLRAMIRSLARG